MSDKGDKGDKRDDKDKGAVVNASSLNRYTFCRRAWWLENVAGMEPGNVEALQHGREAHHRHGEVVASGQGWRSVSLFLMEAGLALVVLSLLAMFAMFAMSLLAGGTP